VVIGVHFEGFVAKRIAWTSFVRRVNQVGVIEHPIEVLVTKNVLWSNSDTDGTGQAGALLLGQGAASASSPDMLGVFAVAASGALIALLVSTRFASSARLTTARADRKNAPYKKEQT